MGTAFASSCSTSSTTLFRRFKRTFSTWSRASQANAYIHGLQTILNLALERAKCMPARTNAEFQTILKTFEAKELIHDGSEREVPRPQDKDLQENQYSGKKKKHTIKNAFVASMFGVILFVSPTYAGRVHDKSIADNYHIPPGFSLWQDTGKGIPQ